MGRGKALRTKVKAEKALTKARLQAKKEWEERTSNFAYGIKKELLAACRRIDPIEMAAVGALTIVIQPIIASTTEISSIIVRVTTPISAIEGFKVIWEWMGLIPSADDQTDPIQGHLVWLISFVIAFIIVRHPEVMTEMFSGATKLTGFALGLLK